MASVSPLAFGPFEVGLTLLGAVAVGAAIAAWSSVFRNATMSSGEKAMWFFAILVFPLFGSIVYFSVRQSW